MNRRGRPKFVTLREFPDAGALRIRILEDERTRLRVLDIRTILPGGSLSRYGVRVANRGDLELLTNILLAVLRDPLL